MIKSFKFKLIIALVFVLLISSYMIPIYSMAINMDEYINPKQFDDSSYNTATDYQFDVTNNGSSKTVTLGGIIISFFARILELVRIIALGWAIIMAISIATKYMSGSSQVMAQLKTDMPTYVIGAVILFGATGIITLVQYFVEDKL